MPSISSCAGAGRLISRPCRRASVVSIEHGASSLGLTFEQFFMQLINTMPATRTMVEEALLVLNERKKIQVLGLDGEELRARVHLKADHVLRLPKRGRFNF